MNKNVLVVDEEFKHFFHNIDQVAVYSPLEYILNTDTENNIGNKVYNLTSTLAYQELGYYVSLLAMARKEKIYPTPRTLQDFTDKKIQKLYSEDIYEMIQKKFHRFAGDSFELSIYFGANLSNQHIGLSWELYRLIQAPLFRVYFKKEKKWQVSKIRLLTLKELSKTHLNFLAERVQTYFNEGMSITHTRKKYFYDIAILHNEDESSPPSDNKALDLFAEAFKKVGIKPYFIQYKDKPNISEYDALFIRETTNVSHYTYKIARNAEKEGLVVIDDPDSIVKCTNKIFLEQLMEHLKIKRPASLVLDQNLFKSKLSEIKFPCIIKKPDSAFSQGVYKASCKEELIDIANNLFPSTHLILIQEYLPTDFDWRIGILNGEVLYACKYYMAKGHWQIINNKENNVVEEGAFECVDPQKVDESVIKTAIKAAKPIGKGLYGVDLKQKGKEVYLIEVNDNPSIEAGVEDAFLGKDLYLKIATHFLNECHKKRGVHV